MKWQTANKIYLVLVYIVLLSAIGLTLAWGFGYVEVVWIHESIDSMPASEKNIVLSEEVKQDLMDYWRETGEKEYRICLTGRAEIVLSDDNKTAGADKYFLEETNDFVKGEDNWVSAPVCTTFATLHKHPSGNCKNYLNTIDSLSAKSSFRNGVALYLIQCGETELEVYTKEDFYEGFVINFE